MSPPDAAWFEETPEGVRLRIKVRARARKEGIAGVVGSAVKVSVNAPAIEGRANRAVIALLAKQLKVPRGSVKIAAGERSAKKTVLVAGLTAEKLRNRLGLTGPLFER